jgi:cell division cycle 2-like protein
MAGPSRWANDEADAAADLQRKKDKEEKKRLKLAKQQAEEAAAAAKAQESSDSRPAKRRRLSGSAENDIVPKPVAERKLLRFEAGGWGPCRHTSNFEHLNDIEEGSYGWVTRACETSTGEVVALKKVKMDHLQDGFPITALREIAILQKARHKNIVDLRETVMGDSMNEVVLVMEFLEHDLKTLQEDMPEPFLASEVKTLLKQLAGAVEFLHDNHIMHRDLKTSNVCSSSCPSLAHSIPYVLYIPIPLPPLHVHPNLTHPRSSFPTAAPSNSPTLACRASSRLLTPPSPNS